MFIIDGALEKELKRLAHLRSPNEAVGLILSDGVVVELDNQDKSHSHFEVNREDIVRELKEEEKLSEVVLWHSHPNGGIGPSRTDMQQKTIFNYHLVLTLAGDEMIPTWY